MNKCEHNILVTDADGTRCKYCGVMHLPPTDSKYDKALKEFLDGSTRGCKEETRVMHEYKLVVLDDRAPELTEIFNELGSDGWIYCGEVTAKPLFKEPSWTTAVFHRETKDD